MIDLYGHSLLTIFLVGLAVILAASEIGWQLGVRSGRAGTNIPTLEGGLSFYRFSYNGSNKAYVGVMAQEVQRVMPGAVVRGRDGYLRVYYDRLGVTFASYDRWVASRARVPTSRIGHRAIWTGVDGGGRSAHER
jgi:hypothetical protein